MKSFNKNEKRDLPSCENLIELYTIRMFKKEGEWFNNIS